MNREEETERPPELLRSEVPKTQPSLPVTIAQGLGQVNLT